MPSPRERSPSSSLASCSSFPAPLRHTRTPPSSSASTSAAFSAAVVEVYVLGEEARFGDPLRFQGSTQVRTVPFDASKLDLDLLWAR